MALFYTKFNNLQIPKFQIILNIEEKILVL